MGVDYCSYGGYGFEVEGEAAYDMHVEGCDSDVVDLIAAGYSGDCSFALVIRDSALSSGLEFDSVRVDFVNAETDALLYAEAERLGLKPKHAPRLIVGGYLSC